MRKRVFISFAKEDSHIRDLMVGQSRNPYCPFEFVDMSVKQPWDHAWKTNCRTKIKGCQGVIAIISSNTGRADGELWEIKCAKEEGIPCLGVWGYSSDHFKTLPQEIMPLRVVSWNWATISQWIDSI